MQMIEYFPNWVTGAIFKNFTPADGLAWVTPETNLIDFDIEYFGNHSGQKLTAPLLNVLEFNPERDAIIKRLILAKFKDKWNRQYEALVTSVYNPINNYDKTEEHTESGTTVGKETGTNTTTSSGTTIGQSNGTSKTNAFNQGMTPTSESHDDNTSTNTNEATSNITNNNDTKTTRSLLITTKGNIGVTTTQQMIESEIELRNKFNFVDMLYKDLDSLLCLSIY